jgi:hypothetical protein
VNTRLIGDIAHFNPVEHLLKTALTHPNSPHTSPPLASASSFIQIHRWTLLTSKCHCAKNNQRFSVFPTRKWLSGKSQRFRISRTKEFSIFSVKTFFCYTTASAERQQWDGKLHGRARAFKFTVKSDKNFKLDSSERQKQKNQKRIEVGASVERPWGRLNSINWIRIDFASQFFTSFKAKLDCALFKFPWPPNYPGKRAEMRVKQISCGQQTEPKISARCDAISHLFVFARHS